MSTDKITTLGAVLGDPAAEVKVTTYNVYRQDEAGHLTQLAASVRASSDLSAIRNAYEDSPGKYVAIPTRYLRVRTVAVESTPRVVIT